MALNNNRQNKSSNSGYSSRSKQSSTNRRPSSRSRSAKGLIPGRPSLSLSIFSRKHMVIFAIAFALIGTYVVFRTFASGSEWRPGSPSVTTTLKTMTKQNGSAYWYAMTSPLELLKAGQAETLPPYSEVGQITLTDTTQGSGGYCVAVQTYGTPGSVRFSGANAMLPPTQAAVGRYSFAANTKGDACVAADLSKGPLTATIERSNARGITTKAQPIMVHRFFKQDPDNEISKKCSQLSNLKFCDDFDGTTGAAPDSTRWNVFKSGSSWGSQCWTSKPENISTDGRGNLKLTLIDTKTKQCTNWYGDPSTVTSGGMDTQSKFTSKYGKFEIRSKLACAKSVWGAAWLSTGTGPGWPQSGEIDIYEIGYDKQNKLQQTIHAGKSGTDKYSIETYASQAARYCDDYHVYGAEWRPGYIQFTLDGKPTNRVTEADGSADATATGKTTYWPFDSYDLRLLIDLQYGKTGTWTGTPNLSELPSSMLIDYVRVYN